MSLETTHTDCEDYPCYKSGKTDQMCCSGFPPGKNYSNDPKFSDTYVRSNSADPSQTAQQNRYLASFCHSQALHPMISLS